MADNDTDTDVSGPDMAEFDSRLDRLEAAVNRLTELLPASHADAQAHTGDKLDQPSTVEDAVRAELARRDKEHADAADKQSIRDEIARLRETPPKPPVPRRTRLLGWSSE
jgi:uncharacterized protein YicC (UPF0701 family)